MDVYDAMMRCLLHMGLVGEDPPHAVPTHRLSEIDRYMVKNSLCEDPPEVEFSSKVSCVCTVTSLGEWKRSHTQAKFEDADIWLNWDRELLAKQQEKRKEWKTLHLPDKSTKV